MKKNCIIYSSKTGNTKKIAMAMYEEMSAEFDIFEVEEKPDTSQYDVVFMGYWIDKGGPNEKAKAFMKTIEGKTVALFHTLGAEPMGTHAMLCAANGGASLGSNCRVAGYFSCQGAIDPLLLEWMRSKPMGGPHTATPENEARWQRAATRPDEEDVRGAKEFIKTTMARIQMLRKG